MSAHPLKMMHLLTGGIANWYIMRTVAVSIFGALIALVALNTVFGLFAELGALKGHYDFSAATLYLFKLLPGQVYQTLPYSVLVGSVWGLGALATSGELSALQGLGMSRFSVLYVCISVSMMLILGGLALTQWVIPQLQYEAEVERRMLRSEGAVGEVVEDGHWLRDGNDLVYVRYWLKRQEMLQVSRYVYTADRKLIEVQDIARATYEDSYWQAHGIRRQIFTPEGIERSELETVRWDSTIIPDSLRTATAPQFMGLVELHFLTKYLIANNLNPDRHDLVFWQRVLQPLSIAVMVLISMIFIFGPMRSHGPGVRLFASIMTGILIVIVQRFVALSSLAYDYTPLVGVLVPQLVLMALGIWFLVRL